jgi:hypothetical protein
MPTLTGVTKYFAKAKEGFTTTLAGTAASGATSVTLASSTGYTNGDTVVLVVDPGNSSKQVLTGQINTSTNVVSGVKWTEGTNTSHTSGATVVDYVTATHWDMLATGILNSLNTDGSLKQVFDVTAPTYGALGDGTTDDTVAIQAAITAAIAAGGGTVYFPSGKTFKVTGAGLSIDPSTLTNPLRLIAYGAKISYETGTGDCFTILTNIAAADVQHAERSVHMEGFHIMGSSAASSGLRVKATFCTFRNMVFEDFTATTSQKAAVILDALFHFWVEECHFENLEIKNTGNGICFISRDESAGTPASLENNYFTNIHVWVAVAGGKGIYGVGLGASTICLMSRCAFYGSVIHIVNVANVVCYDFTLCAVEGVVLISPSADIFTSAATSTGIKYTYTSVLTVLGWTEYPAATLTNTNSGGGNILYMGNGAAANLFRIDKVGNVVAPSLTMLGDIYDANGLKVLEIVETASAVNNLVVQNSATANAPTLKVSGSDATISLNIAPKGSAGTVVILDANFNELAIFGGATASAVNESTFKNAATGGKPSLQATGGDTNIGYDISSKGTGAVTLWSGAIARELAIFADVASAVNQVQISPSATGNAVKVEATGDDSNVALNLISKGTKEIQFNGTDVSGAWITWSPTLTNVTVGNGVTNYAKYKQIGKVVHFRLKFTLGTTSSIGGTITISLPVTANADYANSEEQFNASVTLADAGVNTYMGGVMWASSTTVTLRAWNAAIHMGVNRLLPGTWTIRSSVGGVI